MLLCHSHFKGDGQYSCIAADRRVSVYRPPPESAEKYDVLHSVILSYGSHLLYALHVYGEHTNKQLHSPKRT